MQKISFEMLDTMEIKNPHANDFVKLLVEQGKVASPRPGKIKPCKRIAFCSVNDQKIGIGAIKPVTTSVFGPSKANVPVSTNIDWELGYIYIKEEFRGMHLSGMLVSMLLKGLEDNNLIATTELFPGNSMIHTLQKNGFLLSGAPWKSRLHDGHLGLFIKFKKGK